MVEENGGNFEDCVMVSVQSSNRVKYEYVYTFIAHKQ